MKKTPNKKTIKLTKKQRTLLNELAKTLNTSKSKAITHALELLKQAEDDRHYFGVGNFTDSNKQPKTVIYGKRIAQELPANGVKGVLCRTIDDGQAVYFLRVYDGTGDFIDYTVVAY